MKYKIVIPARYGSSRLPGKPLLEMGGQPMIWHVYQRACETGVGLDNIVVATDHVDIETTARRFGAHVVMTAKEHESGTDRLAEVASKLDWDANDIIVNLQGDEPLIAPDLITLCAKALSENTSAGIATLACPILEQDKISDPNCVKVVLDKDSNALYFSRAPIPFARDGFDSVPPMYLRHIGMYAYRVDTLKRLATTQQVSLEHVEKLEQLRALWCGIKIQVAQIDKAPGHGVDTQDDLERVRALLG